MFEGVLCAVADKPAWRTHFIHYAIASVDAGSAGDAFVLQAFTDVDACWANLYTHRAIHAVTQTLRLAFDRWPEEAAGPWSSGPRIIELARPPVQSIAAVTVYDEDDQAMVVDTDVYRLANGSNDRARLVLRQGQSWPTGVRATDAVEIDYLAGYGDAGTDVPEPIRQGLLALIAFWFEHREGEAWNSVLPSLPIGAASFWRPFRLMRLA